jgi:hypothetical protein
MKKIKIYYCTTADIFQKKCDEHLNFNASIFKNIDGDEDEFLVKIIKQSKSDYALLCKDNVFLPANITEIINVLIKNANKQFGCNNWSMIGNYGIEAITHNTLKYLRDDESYCISESSGDTRFAEWLNDDVILINLKNIKQKNIKLLEMNKTHACNVAILLFESYKNNLIVGIDSLLYIVCENRKKIHTTYNEIHQYLLNNFINHTFKTLNTDIKLAPKVSYLYRDTTDDRIDFYKQINNVIFSIISKYEKKEINIIIRTQLNRPDMLYRLFDTIRIAYSNKSDNIDVRIILAINNVNNEVDGDKLINKLIMEYNDLFIDLIFIKKDDSCYPRVAAIKESVLSIKNDNSFVWIVDDDDFIFPNIFEYGALFLNKNFLFVANSQVFQEVWSGDKANTVPNDIEFSKVFDTSIYYNIIYGNNNVPVCSVIYPKDILKKVFETYKLLGDYLEDYAIFLLAQRYIAIKQYPFMLCGISYREHNTVLEEDRSHWNSSYASFMSEIINDGMMNNLAGIFCKAHQEDLFKFEKMQSSKFWKMRGKYLNWKNKIKFILFSPGDFFKKYFKK